MAALRLFARYAYVPTMMLGLNGFAVYLVAEGHSYAWIGLLFAVAIGLSLLMEQALPYERRGTSRMTTRQRTSPTA